MSFGFSDLAWLPIGVSLVVGQIFMTLFFTVLFGKPWAVAYGPGKTPKEHTKEVPGYTYAIGAACTLAMTLCIAILQTALGVSGIGDALALGVLLSVGLVAASITPGYAFLRRWNAYVFVLASQVALLLIISAVLGAWPR